MGVASCTATLAGGRGGGRRRLRQWAVLLAILAMGLPGSVRGGEADAFTAAGFVRFEQEPMAPDFALLDHEGTPRRLQEWRGHVVLLVFWTTW
jgi:cytochrome oxidase Cu insertion factor (SCO1/SenC/PrrC family)